MHRLTQAREANIREQRAGFRPDRGCIDHILTLRRILEQRRVYHQPTVAVFLDFKGAFDSVDRRSFMRAFLHRGVPNKYVNIIQALYAKTYGCVRAYGELSKEFTTRSGVSTRLPTISIFIQLCDG